MTASAPRRPRGFTLLELVVSLGLTVVVLAAVFWVVQSQQNAFYQGNLQRGAQASARGALSFIEQRLALAGYGMDAPLAFDFTRYGVDVAYPAACPALANGCPRDSLNGNDELVFYERNSRYWVPDLRTQEPRGNAWRVISIAGNVIQPNARPKDFFAKGQILQVVCKAATRYAYMTVAQSVLVPDDAGAERPVAVTLMPSVSSDPFRRQEATALDSCFTSGEARMFLIDRYRFHVRPMQIGDRVQPYLVLDQGLDVNGTPADEADEIVVAEGIESFQVGYVMTNDALVPRGTIPGTAIAFTPGAAGLAAGNGMTTLQYPGAVDPALSEYSGTSWYRYAVSPPTTERMTDHQANIRGVRIAIVARGPDPDPAQKRPEVLSPVLNQNQFPAWIDTTVPYDRARVETTVLVRNMSSRAMNDF